MNRFQAHREYSKKHEYSWDWLKGKLITKEEIEDKLKLTCLESIPEDNKEKIGEIFEYYKGLFDHYRGYMDLDTKKLSYIAMEDLFEKLKSYENTCNHYHIKEFLSGLERWLESRYY